MTDQEINETIALHLGWTKETKEIEHQDGYQWTEVVTHWRIPGGARISSCPDYCNDLNAMHGAEKVLFAGYEDDPEACALWSDYTTNVIIACKAYMSYHATARQKAEAFLRTIGKLRGL